MAADYVLDASALIALVRQENGHERVLEVLDRSAISSVNLAEAVSKLIEKGAPRNQVEPIMRSLDLRVVAWDVHMAYAIGDLAAIARKKGLSLGDRACLTLAARLDATALTSDRGWTGLSIKVEQLR